jgi:hypothetical protein
MGISNVDEEGFSLASKLFGQLPNSPRHVNVSLCDPDPSLSLALLVWFRCWRVTVIGKQSRLRDEHLAYLRIAPPLARDPNRTRYRLVGSFLTCLTALITADQYQTMA